MMNEEAKRNLVKENMGKIREKMEKVARENAIKDLKELQIDIGSSPDDLEQSPLYYALDIAIKALEQQPNSLEQIKWERDTAINQLKELGYGLGEKIEPFEDCVSREQALEAIDTWDKFGYTYTGCFVREPKGDYVPYVYYDDMVKCIKNLPSVKPQRPQGKWIEQNDTSKHHFGWYYCSNCGAYLMSADGVNYCSCCGAKMEVDE